MNSNLDFYIGLKHEAKWIGSCRGHNIFDIRRSLLRKDSWYKFLTASIKYIQVQEISAIPFRGDPWLWQWPDSTGSDYGFYFDLVSNKVLASVNYYENYCDSMLLSKGESLQDADVHISVVYPIMKTQKETL